MKSKNNLKILNILLIFLYLNPFIDLLTSISNNVINLPISIGVLIRGGFLLFLLIYTLFIRKNNLKQNILYLSTLLIYAIAFIILNSELKGSSIILMELQNIFKVFYFPLLLLCIYNLKLDINYKHFVYIALIYMGLIFIPMIFNASFDAYTQGKVGVIGWFNSANEISAILGLCSIFIVKYLFSNNKLIIKILISLLTIVIYFAIGSKIPIIALLISLFYYLCKWFKKSNFKMRFLMVSSVLAIILLSIVIVPKTNLYKNLEIHLDYLEINEVGDMFSYKFVNRFIFSDRLTYLQNTRTRYLNSSFLEKILGIGYSVDGKEDKMVEMDFFDIYYRLGLLGFILVIIPLFISTKNYSKKNKEEKLSITIALLISFLAGHVIASPSVSYNLGIIMSNKSKEE